MQDRPQQPEEHERELCCASWVSLLIEMHVLVEKAGAQEESCASAEGCGAECHTQLFRYCSGTSALQTDCKQALGCPSTNVSLCTCHCVSYRKRWAARQRRALEEHITRMEQVLRALENEQLTPATVQGTQEAFHELLNEEEPCLQDLLHNHSTQKLNCMSGCFCWLCLVCRR